MVFFVILLSFTLSPPLSLRQSQWIVGLKLNKFLYIIVPQHAQHIEIFLEHWGRL